MSTIINKKSHESAERTTAREVLKNAMAKVDALENASTTSTAAEIAIATAAMEKALTNYTNIARNDLYKSIDLAKNPIMDLCKRMTWEAPRINRKESDGTVIRQLTEVKTRLNLLKYIDHARTLPDNTGIYTSITKALDEFVSVLSKKVQAELDCEGDQYVSIKECREALTKVMEELGQGYAQSKDVRFIVYAATKASRANLGQLVKITSDSVAPYIMDVLHIRANNIGYSFEKSEK